MGSQAPQAFQSPKGPVKNFYFVLGGVPVKKNFIFSSLRSWLCADSARELVTCLGLPGPAAGLRLLCGVPFLARGSCLCLWFRPMMCGSALCCAEHIERGQPLSLLLSGGLWFSGIVRLRVLALSLCQHLLDVVLQTLAEPLVYLFLYEWLHLFVFYHLRHA